VGTAVIADGAITNAKLDANAVAANVFAAGVQPIGIEATVPGTKSTDTIFVTADAKLYRWNGSSYVKTVDDGDITGMVVSKLTAGTINVAITTTNVLQLSTSGKIYTAGKTSAASTTAGIFLGWDTDAYKFSVGDATKNMTWNGTTLTFTGDLETAGKVKAIGKTAVGAGFAAIVAEPTEDLVNGVYAKTVFSASAISGENLVSGHAIIGLTDGTFGAGVLGISNGSALYGVIANNVAGGPALQATTSTATGVAIRAEVGNAIIGTATNTGTSNLIISEGAPGSRLNDQMIIYGQLSADSQTTFGLIVEQDVEAGTGSFAGLVQLRIHINGAAYKLPLEAY
jgi:hypothetical protein